MNKQAFHGDWIVIWLENKGQIVRWVKAQRLHPVYFAPDKS